KKRIVMLQKSKSKKLQLVKYLFLLPVMAAMLCVTSCEQTEPQTPQQYEEEAPDKQTMKSYPVAVIEQVPVYPGCENLTTNEEHKQCLSEKITQHVVENFNS